jgi:hypothetical protein
MAIVEGEAAAVGGDGGGEEREGRHRILAKETMAVKDEDEQN